MFINQVDGNGNFKVTDINSDNVNATNGTFVNLNTTTFSPTNVNASGVISTNLTSTNGTIDNLNTTTSTTSGTATSGQISTGIINCTNVNSSGTITGTNLNSTANVVVGGNAVIPHVIVPSNNNLSSNAEVLKLQDELRINSGASGTIGFYQGSTRNMELNTNGNLDVKRLYCLSAYMDNLNTSELNITNAGKLHFYNATGKYFEIEHPTGGDVNFYGAKNNPTSPSSFNFYTADGTQSDLKLKIHGTSDLVELKELSAISTTCINSTVSNLLIKSNSMNNYSLIRRTDNVVKFIGDTSSTGSVDYEFYSDDSNQQASVPKLKILRNSNLVQVINLDVTDSVEATTFLGDQISCVDADFTNITTDDITINDVLDFGANHSKIFSGFNAFVFEGGGYGGGKDLKFATGNLYEVVHLKMIG